MKRNNPFKSWNLLTIFKTTEIIFELRIHFWGEIVRDDPTVTWSDCLNFAIHWSLQDQSWIWSINCGFNRLGKKFLLVEEWWQKIFSFSSKSLELKIFFNLFSAKDAHYKGKLVDVKLDKSLIIFNATNSVFVYLYPNIRSFIN